MMIGVLLPLIPVIDKIPGHNNLIKYYVIDQGIRDLKTNSSNDIYNHPDLLR
jgi:hypothetical protein